MTPDSDIYTTHKTDIRPILSIMKRNKENDVTMFTYVTLFIQVFFEIFINSNYTVETTKGGEVGKYIDTN